MLTTSLVQAVLQRSTLCRVASTLSLAACVASCADPRGRQLDEVEARAVLSPQWTTDLLGFRPPAVFELETGGLRVEPGSAPAEALAEVDVVPGDADAFVQSDDMLVFDVATERTFLVEFDGVDHALLRHVDERETRELTEAAEQWGLLGNDEAESAAAPIAKSIEGDEDSRIRYAIKDGYGKKDWLATIGMVTLGKNANRSGCTGTLLANDVVLTAAHCVISATGTIAKVGFAPRMDGSGSTEGKMPWAHWTTDLTYYTPNAYTSNRCHEKYTESCVLHDWALVRYQRPAGNALNLYMRARTVETREMTHLKNRGYGDCGSFDAPPSCQAFSLFGDRMSCRLVITGTLSGDQGYSQSYSHSCDTNPGHSGSPMYIYDAAGLPTVAGVHVAGPMKAGAALGTGNWMHRITPSMATKIATFK
jgi:V8-like Glu-specific endopeptidase